MRLPVNAITRSLPMAALALAFVSGCATEVGSAYILPFDGQTDWPVDRPIEVALNEQALPGGYPLDPGLLRVVDLTNGGIVEGDLVHEGRMLRFYPTDGWKPSTDYAWTLSPSVDRNREPQLLIPPALQGDAFFSTTSRLEVVNAVQQGERLCLQLSRAFDDDRLMIWVNGERGAQWSIVEVMVGGVEEAQPNTLHALCAPTPDADSVRVEVDFSEVYQLEPTGGDTLSAFRRLHRVKDP